MRAPMPEPMPTGALQPIVDLLDSGLLLYRRSFLRLLTITAFFVPPFLILLGMVFVPVMMGDGSLRLVWLFLMLLLGIYLVNGLSRTSLLLQRGEPIPIGMVLRIGLIRLVGMIGYGLFYALVVGVAATIAMVALAWVANGLESALSDAARSTGGADPVMRSVSTILSIFSGIVMLLRNVLGVVVAGAAISAIVYGLQPFVQDEGPLREAVRRSIALTRYRLDRNLLAFLVSSSVAIGLGLVVIASILSLLNLLRLLELLGSQSVVALLMLIAVFVGGTFGLLAVVPPVPIWMVLLYQHNDAAYTGADLAAQIAALAAAPTEEEVAAHAGTNA